MRSARFMCALYCIIDEEKEFSVTGTLEGFIGTEMRGENGFGYDPIFMVDEERSLAEMSAEEKNGISHRAAALKQLTDILRDED